MTVWLALFLAIGAVGTWLARAYALQRNLIDHPGDRRSHGAPTPRGGGIAIVLCLLVATLALAVRDPSRAIPLGGFALALLLVAGIGWWDDHRPLPVWVRLAVQVTAASVLAVAVFSAYGQVWLALASFAAAVVLTNVWNFMDGINGIAATQAALVATGFAVAVSGTAWGWLGWALVAACLGFLPFNFPRARIFLGDVGSGALGLAIAALAIAVMGEGRMPWPLVFLPPSAFLIDAGLTLGQRLVRGERWWTAHDQHAYQGLARRVGGHARVTLAYAAWTGLALLLMAVLRSGTEFSLTLAAVLAWYMSGVFLWVCLQRRGAGNQRGDRNKMEWHKE